MFYPGDLVRVRNVSGEERSYPPTFTNDMDAFIGREYRIERSYEFDRNWYFLASISPDDSDRDVGAFVWREGWLEPAEPMEEDDLQLHCVDALL